MCEDIVIPPSTLAEDMRSLLNNKVYKDVNFSVEDKAIYALKGILCDRSEFFWVMFTSSLQESTKDYSINWWLDILYIYL